MALSPEVVDAINAAAAANGLDPQMLFRFAKIESDYDPSNRTGSYHGLFQLSGDEFKKYGGGNIYDPVDNANAAARKLAAESAQFQAQYGRAPTATDFYLIHNQGAGGYAAHMANPDAPAWQNMAGTKEGREKGPGWARQAIWDNIPDDPRLSPNFNKTMFPGGVDSVRGQDFIGGWQAKLEGGTPQVAAVTPQGTPPQSLPRPIQPDQPPPANAPTANPPAPGGLLAQAQQAPQQPPEGILAQTQQPAPPPNLLPGILAQLQQAQAQPPLQLPLGRPFNLFRA
jgi:hypothetical protein